MTSVGPSTLDFRLRYFSVRRVQRSISRVRACAKRLRQFIFAYRGCWRGDVDLRWTVAEEHLFARIERIATCRCRDFVPRLRASRSRECFLKPTALPAHSHLCARCSVIFRERNPTSLVWASWEAINSCDWLESMYIPIVRLLTHDLHILFLITIRMHYLSSCCKSNVN